MSEINSLARGVVDALNEMAVETRLICTYYYMKDGSLVYVKEPEPLPRNRSLVKV